MIPIFSSHYSIGKSILTLDIPNENEEGPTSIFKICQDQNLEEIFLVENSLTGLPEALKNSAKLGLNLRFGLKFEVCEENHKIIVFARNTGGLHRLRDLYSLAFSRKECLSESILKKHWSKKDLMLAIPFYDSFLYKNIMSFDGCTPDFKSLNPLFFIEKNSLPFDSILEKKVLDYANSFNLETQIVKTILYNKKEDCDALLTYKCICLRKFGNKSLSKPNVDHFGSNEFCMESYLEH
jgi:DNA polymerase III alpha subunit